MKTRNKSIYLQMQLEDLLKWDIQSFKKSEYSFEISGKKIQLKHCIESNKLKTSLSIFLTLFI